MQKNKQPIIVWGAGSYTLRLLANTPLKDGNIKAFIDNDKVKQQRRLNDVEIHSPEFLNENHEPIFICSGFRANEIMQEIQSRGIQNKVFVI